MAHQIDHETAQLIIAVIIRAPKVYLKNGTGHSRKQRWVSGVVERMQEIGMTVADLFAAHMAGVIELSRCDLPQCFADGFTQEAIMHGNASFHFVRVC